MVNVTMTVITKMVDTDALVVMDTDRLQATQRNAKVK